MSITDPTSDLLEEVALVEQAMAAIQAGDAPLLSKLLQNGLDVHDIDLLVHAATVGTPNILHSLHAAGADLAGVRDEESGSGLVFHANPGNIETLAGLGCNLNASNGNGLSPVYCAATGLTYNSTVHDETLRMATLVRCGADINGRDESYKTPLMKLVSIAWVPGPLVKKLHIINLMIDLGADANARDPDGVSVLMKSFRATHTLDVAELLMDRGARLDPGCGQLETLAEAALKEDRLPFVQTLHAQGLDLTGARFQSDVLRLDAVSTFAWMLDVEPSIARLTQEEDFPDVIQGQRCSALFQAHQAKIAAQLAIDEYGLEPPFSSRTSP